MIAYLCPYWIGYNNFIFLGKGYPRKKEEIEDESKNKICAEPHRLYACG